MSSAGLSSVIHTLCLLLILSFHASFANITISPNIELFSVGWIFNEMFRGAVEGQKNILGC